MILRALDYMPGDPVFPILFKLMTLRWYQILLVCYCCIKCNVTHNSELFQETRDRSGQVIKPYL